MRASLLLFAMGVESFEGLFFLFLWKSVAENDLLFFYYYIFAS